MRQRCSQRHRDGAADAGVAGVSSAGHDGSCAAGSVDPQGAMLPGVTVTVRNQDTGMYPRDRQRRGWLVHRQRHRPGPLRGRRPSCRASRSSTAATSCSRSARPRRIDVALEVGALTETVNVTTESPLVDVTSKEIGGNITGETLTSLPSVNGNFIGFIGLLPGHRPVDQHRVVRQRRDQRQRPGSAQQQLLGRRRQQQRRRHRAAGGDAGADADRGDPGVPGHHQPVRRRVRPHLRRGGQRGDQGRAPTACAAARSASSRTAA